MTQVSRRLPVLLAVLTGMVMAITAWGLLPNTAYADDEVQLDTISLSNSTDAGWMQFYSLDAKGGEVLKEENLGIVVHDNNGSEVDRADYDLAVKPFWWDEESESDVYGEAVDLDEGFALAGPNTDGGFAEFEVFATPKEDTGYVGEVSAQFYVIDTHSLEYICAEIDFPGNVKRSGWRMHDRFTFRVGQAIAPVVKAECGSGEPLTEGTDYSVTYYPRSHQDEDMNDPAHGFEYFLDTDVDPLDGPPTEPGGYFAVIEGIGDYYGGNTVLIDLNDVECEYFDEPGDETLLLHDDREIREMRVRVEDSEHPGGWEKWMRILDAEITEQHPDAGNGDVLSLDKNVWKYRAENTGSAVIRVTYEDWDNTETTRSFTVFVQDLTYDVNMWSEEGIYKGLPGDEIPIRAQAEKRWIATNGGDPNDWHYESEYEGFDYEWTIVSGRHYAEIKQNPDDPGSVTLKLKDLPPESERERIEVKVTAYDRNDEPDTPRADNQQDYWSERQFYQIYPTQIDSNLDVGKTLTINPELRLYKLGQSDYEVIDGVDFEIRNYDDEAIEVNGLTIKRLKDWNTNFSLTAEWGDDGWNEQWYHLNDKHYRPEFGFGDVDVYDDHEVTLEPWIEGGESLESGDYELKYTVGSWDGERNDWDTIFVDDNTIAEGVEFADINGDKLILNGAKIDAALRNLNIHVELWMNDERFGDTWCWVNLRDSCEKWGKEHNWIKGVVKKPTLDEVGYELWICPDYLFLDGCGENRLVEIPKLINISKATVKVAGATYNKKALTPALTVTYSGETLKSGTDYTAKYTNNTNAGDKAVVTLSGKGKYGGTKKQYFTIQKAANPIALKAKAVTVKAAAVAKKNQTVKIASAVTVSGAQGKVTWKKASGNAKITVAADGKITVKKGLKKGKYKTGLKATAAGDANYKSGAKTVNVTITVK